MPAAVDLLPRYYELGNAASAEADADAAIRADLRAAVDRGNAPAMQAVLDMVDEDAEFTAAEAGETVFRGQVGQIQLFEQRLDVMTAWRCEASEFTEGPNGFDIQRSGPLAGAFDWHRVRRAYWCMVRFKDGKVAFHEFQSFEAARAVAGLE